MAQADVPGLQATLRGRLLEHAEVRAEVARLELGRNADRRLSRLSQSGWRHLRATEWEHFLKQVFTELGWQVRLTGMSGDQGVDLVLQRDGRKVAVQAKGYAGGVPNSSVQQAYAGQSFYECHACAVVTNSRFTDSAEELAAKLGCVLIDGEQLTRLMTGQLDFWRLCFGDPPPTDP
ncbi:MAG: restriction endonuclease [Planctomycetaceae bacterium]